MENKIIAFNHKKDATDLTIGFNAFASNPIVLITPCFSRENGYVETVTEVDVNSATTTSSSKGNGYSVNVMVIASNCKSFGNLDMQVGNAPKTAKEFTIKLDPALGTQFPTVLLTPRYSKAVGHVEGVKLKSANSITIASENVYAKDYTVQYAAIERGIGTEGGQTLQTGIVNHTENGLQRVFFSAPYVEIPTVILTPWYDNKVTDMHRATITSTTMEYFEFTTGSSASNYYIEWAAFGRMS